MEQSPGQKRRGVAPGPLSYHDFEGYGRWRSERQRRSTGHPSSPHTLRTAQTIAAAAAKSMGVLEEEDLGRLLADRSSVEKLFDRMAARQTTGAMRYAVYSLMAFGEYAVAMGWIEAHAMLRSDIPPQNPPKPITVYSPDEMDEFVSLSRERGLRWWAFIVFLADTGRRVGETLNLEWGQFRLDAEPTAYVELPVNKSGDPQYVPLTKRLREEVLTARNVNRLKAEHREGWRAWNRDPAVYPFPWTYGTAKNRFAHFCKVTGLPDRGFHNFRHTVITQRLAAGVPLQQVSALAGHSNPMITASRYNHVNALSAVATHGNLMGF